MYYVHVPCFKMKTLCVISLLLNTNVTNDSVALPVNVVLYEEWIKLCGRFRKDDTHS